MSTLYRTAPSVIVHVPTANAFSAERICSGLIGAFTTTTARCPASVR
ncbi:hypothetical protein ACIRD3_25905 [Kitasatospora sp. NPDC093550]